MLLNSPISKVFLMGCEKAIEAIDSKKSEIRMMVKMKLIFLMARGFMVNVLEMSTMDKHVATKIRDGRQKDYKAVKLIIWLITLSS